MKKRVWQKAAVSAALAAAVLIVPAGAHYMALDGITIMPNEETQQFWNTHKSTLNAQGIYEHSADGWSFCPELNDGLLLIQDTVSPTEEYATWDNYVDKNGQLHDLNKGRYLAMYSFSGGLASVKSMHSEMHNYMYNVGYVDTKGNEVIPCNDDWCSFQYDSLWYQGAFKNGKTVILRSPELPNYGYYNGVDYDHPTDTASYDSMNPQRWYGIEYAYIDTKGNMLTDWKLTQDINTVLALPLYDQDGIRLYDRINGLGSSSGLPGQELPGGEQPEPEEEENAPFVPEYHAPELPDYNREAESLFASTAKVTGFYVGMADLGSIYVTVTNSTEMTDAGVVALAAMNEKGAGGRAGVFFIPYEVAAGSSQTYSVDTRDIIHQEMFGGIWGSGSDSAALLEEYTEMAIITFADEADMQAFYNTIPYEQHWYPRTLANDFQPVCDGVTGSVWLEQTLGFHREAEYEYFHYEFPNGESATSGEVDHGLCAK